MKKDILTKDVLALRGSLKAAFRTAYEGTRKVGSYTYGIYAFYDYDGEPIYVGQTREGLSSRVSRHLTNQRTDAVAMNVLDPFEVEAIEFWPLPGLEKKSLSKAYRQSRLDAAEAAVFALLVSRSRFKAVLNEETPTARRGIRLPRSLKISIVPESVRDERSHADIRLARRAQTIAALAKVISERSVSSGLRQTLVTQARRLAYLAKRRRREVEKMGAANAGDQE